MNFNDIHLLFGEKLSLFAFHFKAKRAEHEIKYFNSLYREYSFIKRNYLNQVDDFNAPIHDGTYSLSIQYRRYKVFLRKKRLNAMPNWIAITISLFSLLANIAMLYVALGL